MYNIMCCFQGYDKNSFRLHGYVLSAGNSTHTQCSQTLHVLPQICERICLCRSLGYVYRRQLGISTPTHTDIHTHTHTSRYTSTLSTLTCWLSYAHTYRHAYTHALALDAHPHQARSLAGFPRPPAVWSLLFLIRHLKEILKDLLVLVVDDGGNFKLSLQSFDLVLKAERQTGHLDPLLHLLEELYQTGHEKL